MNHHTLIHFAVLLLVEIQLDKITYEWLDKCCPYSSREDHYHSRHLWAADLPVRLVELEPMMDLVWVAPEHLYTVAYSLAEYLPMELCPT